MTAPTNDNGLREQAIVGKTKTTASNLTGVSPKTQAYGASLVETLLRLKAAAPSDAHRRYWQRLIERGITP